MFQNYLKIALRNLLKNKAFSLINISGLSIGMAGCILVLLYVSHEFSYDKFHPNLKNLYRVNEDIHFGTNWHKTAMSPAPLIHTLKEFPEVDKVSRLYNMKQALLKTRGSTQEDLNLFVNSGYAVDPEFLDIFNFPLISGGITSALSKPNNILLTEKTVMKLFGESDMAISEIITIGDTDFIVAGILKDIPSNSNFMFDFLVPMSYQENRGRDLTQWNRISSYTYLSLKPGYDYQEFTEKMTETINIHFKDKDDPPRMYLQPVSDIHLYTGFGDGLMPGNDIKIVRIYILIAALILILACINFMNLSTARFEKRSKEVGLRKVVGARRRQLIFQFLGESVLFSIVSMMVAVLLADLLLPVFNQLAQKQLSLWGFINHYPFSFIGSSIGITFLTGVLAGSYPAFFLSSFSPSGVLKRQGPSSTKATSFRKALVVIQFTLAIVFIIGTLTISDQLEYIRNKELGYDKDNLIYFKIGGDLKSKYDVFRDKLIQNTRINNIVRTGSFPTGISSIGNFNWEGVPLDEKRPILSMIIADTGFISTFKIQIADGFKMPNIPNDTSRYFVINEEAWSLMKQDWGDDTEPIGKRFEDGKIVSVVKDFHFSPLNHEIEPLILELSHEGWRRNVVVRISPLNIGQTLNDIKLLHEKINPEFPLEIKFVDQYLETRYLKDQHTGEIIGYVSIFAIFISCLGLFGLASFTAEQRTKELGIRKVLGATIYGLFVLVSKDFTKLVLMSFLIAAPVAFVLINNWLDGFAYHISLGTDAFVIGGMLAFIIAMVTVSYQSLKAASANPVDSLQNE